MRCHQHAEVEAVAICVACGRGICRECLTPDGTLRSTCGLPQCAGFAKRQHAVHVAVRQDCANNATSFQSLATVMRVMAGLLLLLTLGVLALGFIVGPLAGWVAAPGPVESTVVGTLCGVLAATLLFATKKLTSIGLIYEDLAREFHST